MFCGTPFFLASLILEVFTCLIGWADGFMKRYPNLGPKLYPANNFTLALVGGPFLSALLVSKQWEVMTLGDEDEIELVDGLLHWKKIFVKKVARVK